jgi:Tol biopolymer transport system component
MIGPEGRVKILDFGLASERRSSEHSTTFEMSSPGIIMGTPGYMSPEQVRGEPADARSDLFSLGVILYEMAAGRPAFQGDSSIERMNSILRDEPAELPPTTPPALDRIIRRCLEKLPTSRFQSAADLGFALGTLSLPALPATAPKSLGWLKWPAAILAVLVLGAGYWLGLRFIRQTPAAAFQLHVLSDDDGLAVDGTFSPDGKLVAYSTDRANPPTRDIWLQQPSGGSSIRLTDDHADDTDPAFSYDGTQIAFRSERGGGGIYVVPTLGGDERELVPGGRDPSFSPDGRWLMYRWIQNYHEAVSIRPVAGGDTIQIVDDSLVPCNSVWSPDGKRIFCQTGCNTNERHAMVSRVDVKEAKASYGLDRFSGTIEAWLPYPSRLIGWERVGDEYVISVFPISEDGTRSTGPPQRLTSVTDQPQHVAAAPDGRLVISISTAKAHFWGLPIDEQSRVAGEARQLTFGSDELRPVLSKDGKLLIFNTNRANVWRFVAKDLATGRMRELSTSPVSDLMTELSSQMTQE